MAAILVIDDDVAFVEMMKEYLVGKGHHVTCAHDGVLASAQLKLDRPDLILLDYLMPGGTGTMVLAQLQGSPATAQIPVVLISGTPAEQIRGYAAHKSAGVRYLPKPVKMPELDALIAELVR